MEKVCKNCKQQKAVDSFSLNKASKDGYQSWCKQCQKERVNKWRKDNPEKHKNNLKASYRNNIEKRVKYNQDYIQDKKDGLYHVYIIEDYAGMTENPWHRKKHHKARHGRDINQFRIVYSTPNKKDAWELEAFLHDLGYKGRNQKNNPYIGEPLKFS